MDALDLGTVTLLRSPDVRDWPVTASITAIDVRPDNITFEFTKKDGPDRWPDQPFGDPTLGGSLEYTVWLFLQLGGTWYGAAFVELWFGRDGVGDSISDFPRNWYDARNFWAPMTGHIIAPGELIGFMVSAGNARLNADSSVHERSNIVLLAAPANDTGHFDFPNAPPTPAPLPFPPPARIPVDLGTLTVLVRRLITALEDAAAVLRQLVPKA